MRTDFIPSSPTSERLRSRCTHLLPFSITLLVLGCINDNLPNDRSPKSEEASFRFADPDLGISLVASEPQINSPVDIAWGPDGALFVAEMTGYPITTGKGSVKKLTDPDGDGFYQEMTVFGTGFDFPSSVMYFDGGLFVADAPNVYYLKDTTNDGIADVREVYLTGFTKSNEQYLVNSLHWGLDNWIYGANGRSGGLIRFADREQTTSIENRDFRFNPFTKDIEAVTGQSQFGLARDNWGNRFITLNHRFARQVVLEPKYLNRNPSLATEAIIDTYQSEHDRRVYTLLTDALRFNRDPIGYFTSLSGLTAYRGHLLGPEYENSFFAGESVQAAVIRRRMELRGVTFAAIDMEEDAEFLASTDDWFHPVNFSNGPDGALYLVDFYRRFVEHPEWVHNDNGDGIDWNEGEQFGRIWRIARKDAPHHERRMQPSFTEYTTEELVSELADPAAWRRDMAQQLLLERQDREAGIALEPLLSHQDPLARLHGLWTLSGLDLLTEEHVLSALRDQYGPIRIQALRLAERMLATASDPLLSQVRSLASDQDEGIRFHAILALGAVADAETKRAMMDAARQYSDRWTRTALLSSTVTWASQFAKELLEQDGTNEASNESDNDFYTRLGGMVALSEDNLQTAGWTSSIVMSHKSRHPRGLAFLTGYFSTLQANDETLPPLETNFISSLIGYTKSNSVLVAKNAVSLLQYSASRSAYSKLLTTAKDANHVDVAVEAIKTIAQMDNEELCTALHDQLSSLDPKVRKAVISHSQASLAASHALLGALEKEEIQVTEIPEELRIALMAHTDADLQVRATNVLGSAVDANRQTVIDHYAASIEGLPVDLNQGAAVFARNCTTCHAINGYGGLLGPDLTNIGSRSDDVLLTSILDPSRMVSYELKVRVIEMRGGQILSGTVSGETATSLTVQTADGEEQTVLKANIVKDTWTEHSIMPAGLERIIDEQSMADLIAFLRNPGSADLSSL